MKVYKNKLGAGYILYTLDDTNIVMCSEKNESVVLNASGKNYRKWHVLGALKPANEEETAIFLLSCMGNK